MDSEDPKVLQFPGVRMRGPDKADEPKIKLSVPAAKESKRPVMNAVDDLRQLVATGDVEGFIVIARSKSTGLFYTDIAYPGNSVPPVEAFAYLGALECVKLEVADIAAMAPSVLADGSIMDPECAR